jgi:bifunctional pyridoxal-dependent enzyme with beta-cystathionase and maltose regulon repressor activities
MTINNNLNAMSQNMNAMNDSMTKIARAMDMGQMSGDAGLSGSVTDNLIDEIANQIPQQIGYEMNAQVVSIQNAVMESLISISI